MDFTHQTGWLNQGRPYSRNAMTQVEPTQFGSPTKRHGGGRESPPNRQYIEISGQEGRAASRAETLKYSKTTPNLSDYNDNNNTRYDYQSDNGNRRMSYSRHFEPQQKRTNGYHNDNSNHSDSAPQGADVSA